MKTAPLARGAGTEKRKSDIESLAQNSVFFRLHLSPVHNTCDLAPAATILVDLGHPNAFQCFSNSEPKRPHHSVVLHGTLEQHHAERLSDRNGRTQAVLCPSCDGLWSRGQLADEFNGTEAVA